MKMTDAGLLLGWGVFETVRVTCGVPEFYERHLDRMRRGAGTVGIPFDEEMIRRRVTRALAGVTEARLRITLTAGEVGPGLRPREAVTRPGLYVQVGYLPRPKRAVKLAIVSVRRPSPRVMPVHVKAVSYLPSVLARHEALAAGADEALMLSERGHVAEADAANVFWWKRGVLYTPSLETGALEGVMRGVVIEASRGAGIEVREGLFGPKHLLECDGAFLTSSLRGQQAIGAIGCQAMRLDISSMLPPGTGL